MALITIHPVSSSDGKVSFRAVTSDAHSEGATAGQALDALGSQLNPAHSAIILVQSFAPDSFFDAHKTSRLQTLMEAWRSARASGHALPADEQAELQRLIDEELAASAARTSAE